MNIGMLWFDNDPKTDLGAKIAQAASYYYKKYGQQPDLCFIHPSLFAQSVRTEGIEIRPNQAILPHHLWLGIHESVNAGSLMPA